MSAPYWCTARPAKRWV